MLIVLAPLPNVSKRTRLSKLFECNTTFSKINFYGWQRLVNEKVSKKDKIILKGGGYSSVTARVMYLLWVNKVFIHALAFRKKDVIWALGFESAFPCVLASKLKGFKVIYDDADRFSSLFNFPKSIKKLLVELEKFTSHNSYQHIIPGIERYEFKSPKFFILKNTPTSDDLVKAKNFKLDNKIEKSLEKYSLTIYINGWLSETRGLKIIHNIAKEMPTIGFIMAGRIDSKYAEAMRELDNVIYLGEVPQYEALAYYRISDLVFTYYDPSIPINRFAEANKWGDALQFSVPVIVNSEVLTAQYLRESNSCISVEYDNEIGLKEAIYELQSSPQKYQDLVKSIKKLQQKFPTFDEQLDRLFQNIE